MSAIHLRVLDDSCTLVSLQYFPFFFLYRVTFRNPAAESDVRKNGAFFFPHEILPAVPPSTPWLKCLFLRSAAAGTRWLITLLCHRSIPTWPLFCNSMVSSLLSRVLPCCCASLSRGLSSGRSWEIVVGFFFFLVALDPFLTFEELPSSLLRSFIRTPCVNGPSLRIVCFHCNFTFSPLCFPSQNGSVFPAFLLSAIGLL